MFSVFFKDNQGAVGLAQNPVTTSNSKHIDVRRHFLSSSKIEGGRGCSIFVPVLGGIGTKIAPTGDIFDQPPGQVR